MLWCLYCLLNSSQIAPLEGEVFENTESNFLPNTMHFLDYHRKFVKKRYAKKCS